MTYTSTVGVESRDRVHVAVAMTCFNRREKTLASLEALHVAGSAGVHLTVHLVDDGSTDGTGDAVRAAYPTVHVILGNGRLFWNGGMRVAMADALLSKPDAVLWLNDDTVLFPDALRRMLALWKMKESECGRHVIVVGSTQDPKTGRVSYGGRQRGSTLRPFRFGLVTPDPHNPVSCETMNGNCVLFPSSIVSTVGELDAGFLHSMGDLDYGLRCGAAGHEIWVLPGYAGHCRNDAPQREVMNRRISLRDYWKDVTGFRKCPPGPWWLFCRRHGGVLGPLLFMKPYVDAVWRGLLTGRI